MPETPIHLGVDVGTQGVRCVAWREGGIVARHTAPLRTANPQSGWATQNPEEIWAAFREAVGGTVAALGPDRSAVHGLGIDATASIFITAPDGRPLMDSILWMDVRAEEYARTIGALVGQPESAELPWSKALWLFEHRPDLFQSGNQLVEVADWLIWRLTGQPVRSYASALLKWHAASRSGLPEWAKLFPEVVELLPTRVVGVAEPVEVIQPRAAESLGLPPGQVLVAGPIIDAYAGAIGSGALQNGTMALILGSSNCELFHGHDLPRQAGLWGPFADVYGLGLDVLEAGQPSTGSVVRWVERHFGHGLPLGELDRQAAAVAPGSDGLKVFPAFQGVRSPWP
ncbi:MAG: FGGY family carbohydrate kinase, partial [Firmicutes bacterium]|nr:FGGY family carbohydrate kinase [Bacillota bacterium]